MVVSLDKNNDSFCSARARLVEKAPVAKREHPRRPSTARCERVGPM